MEKLNRKSCWSFVAITFLSFTFTPVAHSTHYSVSDSGSLCYFDASGQLTDQPNQRPSWDRTNYTELTLLSLLNTYFAPDYAYDSKWDNAYLYDINQANQAVGMLIYSSVNYSLLLDGNKVSVFGTWSLAMSINNHGQIVGEDGAGLPSLFVTNAALLPDIHDFIPSTGSIYFSSLDSDIPMEEVVIQNNTLGHLGAALDNNDSGQISGVGQGFSYLLTPEATPVPEPSTIFLLGSGLAAVCLWRRRTNSHS